MSDNNGKYWARRLKKMEEAIQDRSYGYVLNLERQYDAAISELDTQIRAWYQRIAANNGISYAAAQKLLNANELEEFHWTVQEYIKRGKENGISADWSKELENASAKVHISRLESLKLQIRQKAEELSAGTLKATENASRNAFTESYYHTAFEIQKGLGVGWTMQGMDESRFEKVLSRPWTADGKTFKARCWTDKNTLLDVVSKELTRMVATGEAPDRAIEAIEKRFSVSKVNAGRLVMTESAFFAIAAQKDCFKDLDVERYVVVGTLDRSTCELCGEMDGKVFPMSAFEPGNTAPPFHPWCRCCTAPYFEDMQGLGERFARDPETGETYTVPKDMTYKEWKAKYVDKTVKNGIINIQIDEFVPCLKDAKTGEILQTEIRGISRSSLSKYNSKTGWSLDWKNETPKDQHVLGVFLKGDTEAQGLISIRHDKGGTFLAYAEAAPWNNKYLYGKQKYIGVGGHLFAAAIEESVLHGNGGCVYGYAADEKLLKHYIKDFGAVHYPFAHQYHFVIEGKAAERLLKIYTFERN